MCLRESDKNAHGTIAQSDYLKPSSVLFAACFLVLDDARDRGARLVSVNAKRRVGSLWLWGTGPARHRHRA
eukprot:547134-Amphidinium_carterae.1